MREIKFRYVFRRKQDGHIWMLIVPIEAIEDGSGQLATMLSNELWELISRDQFTGLKDKGGVEIYEGDIVHSIHSDADSIVQFGLWEEGNGFYLNGDHSNSGSCNMGYDVHGNLNYLEIRGNIHHNKDLLK